MITIRELTEKEGRLDGKRSFEIERRDPENHLRMVVNVAVERQTNVALDGEAPRFENDIMLSSDLREAACFLNHLAISLIQDADHIMVKPRSIA